MSEYLRELTEEEFSRWNKQLCDVCSLSEYCDPSIGRHAVCCHNNNNLRITPDGDVVLVLGRLK